ncbi:MAG TPA: bifunctional glutamate N-acetyltransferase/amino-acid acetyltransferase ArgJ [Sulfurospirillum arcachonense]|nr:bifunctional glutamate N-acetyltransferase/amino-acid acetyltransferase ArgJ [Sulfurospirillum arcachonense]HIP45470.1 bifunctional glutamate N-acetyltransferase/amino-acid acetyltransferase ArgJ [Sulfurospirillum arcachonense]
MFDIFPLENGLENVEGFFCDGVSSGLKAENQNDLAFIRSSKLCDVSAVFTQNRFRAAPICHFLNYGKNFKTNFVLLNSKNANAMTGAKGVKDIEEIFSVLKEKLPTIENPIMSSTGVIGYRLDKKKITTAFDKFDFNSNNSDNTAQAIMTTDGFKKELCFKVELEDGDFFHIAAICKGAGMINPSMATMLCFILTDAKIPKNDMDELLHNAIEQSFNTISVDGDTSTNDTVMMLNSAKNCYDKEAFSEALNRMTKHLSQEILRDGEGSNKVVAFEVKNALNIEEAQKASRALSNSLLVKTALFGEDPNWGRIASTIGASRITCKEEDLVISYDNVIVYSKEYPSLDEETEQKAFKVMKQDSYRVTCDLNAGESSYTSYGCDLSYEYVKINADYRT